MYKLITVRVKLPMLTLQISDTVQYYCMHIMGCRVVFCDLLNRTQREMGQGVKEGKGEVKKQPNTLHYAYKVSHMKY
jgi:hypothetical protein